MAQDASFALELNNARDIDSGCRLTYVATNGTGTDLEKTSYEVAVFDKDGVVSQLLILEFGKLPKEKTKVVQFDLAGKTCADISRLLVNGAAECTSTDGPFDSCMDALATSSRAAIEFGI